MIAGWLQNLGFAGGAITTIPGAGICLNAAYSDTNNLNAVDSGATTLTSAYNATDELTSKWDTC